MRKRSKHYSIISGLGTKRTEITLDSAVLATYAGQYEAAEEEGTFTVKREQDVLSLELPISWALPKFRLHPETRTDFFVAELPVRVTFQVDREGHVTGMLVYPPCGQRSLQAKRISSQ